MRKYSRGFGNVFAVGKARVLEALLLSPNDLKAAFNAKDFHAAEAVIKSRPFGRLIDAEKKDFGMGEYIVASAGIFSEISQSAGFFTADSSRFLEFLEKNNRDDILSALGDRLAPLSFYELIDAKRKTLMGKIEGEDVLEYVWLTLWWQARIVRMILSAKKQKADFKYVG